MGLVQKVLKVVVQLGGVPDGLKNSRRVGKPDSGALAYVIPMPFNPDTKWRVLDTFDWYSAWYQSKHTYEQVFRWFESCGLEDLKVIDQPIAVQGRKPVSAERQRERGAAEVEQCVG